jgi:hypothetical protein
MPSLKFNLSHTIGSVYREVLLAKRLNSTSSLRKRVKFDYAIRNFAYPELDFLASRTPPSISIISADLQVLSLAFSSNNKNPQIAHQELTLSLRQLNVNDP